MSFSGSRPTCFSIMRAPTSGVAPKLLMPRVLPLSSLSDLYSGCAMRVIGQLSRKPATILTGNPTMAPPTTAPKSWQ